MQNKQFCALVAGCMTYHEFHELMMPSVSQRYTNELDTIVSAFHNNNRCDAFSMHGFPVFYLLARSMPRMAGLTLFFAGD